MKVIGIRNDRCLGCKTCELYCAAERGSESKTLLGAVQETPLPQPRVCVEGASGAAFPLQCRHCLQAPCLDACLTGLEAQAAQAGIATGDFRRLTAGLTADASVLAALDQQPEFRAPVWDYLAGLVDAERVADGRQRLEAHRPLLEAIAERYRVEPEVVVAIWGVESDYGRIAGKRPLLRSLATLSCHGRRQAFFRGELFAALAIVRDQDIAAEDLLGSWAGAFGQTQFMPSTFQRLAVDFDGDGRRDLIGSVADALASTANYLRRANWRRGEPWGLEVRLPAGFDAGLAGRSRGRALSEWQVLGVTAIDGSPLQRLGGRAALLLPAGAAGPALLVGGNFDALYRYNASENYALAIGHLADRLRGAGPWVTPWPTDDPGLSRAERRELQGLLLARGHDIGEIDGLLGERSRAAIRAEQRALGWPEDGRAGKRLLAALRAADTAAVRD